MKITGNDVFSNGFHNLNGSAGEPCGSWAWGGGITLSTSGRTHTRNDAIDVGHNRVVGNCSGITGADQHRTEHHCGVDPLCELADVSVHDNTIGGSTARGAHNMTGAWRDDHDNLATHNILFTKDTFTRGAKFCGLAC